tara:strand:+ start:404 stop:1324 length:921 start_codon:yes stop_codon:yes gene_type:complete
MESSHSHNNIDEIDFKELFKILWDGKLIILSTTGIFALLTILYSLSLPNIYQSNALLNPVEGSGQMSNGLGGYSTIANLTGLNLSTTNSDSNAAKALKKINTLSFFVENILPNIFLPDLIAVDSWDPAINKIIYNKDIYNDELKSWVQNSKTKLAITSPQSAYLVFLQNNLVFSSDLETGFITIGIKHQSPYIAKEWTEIVIDQLNDFYRKKDKAEAQISINFLNQQIAQTNFTEIKEVIAQLIQNKTQQLALVESGKFYVFEYLDPPAVMERKSEPRRAMITILGTIIGGFFAVLIVILRKYSFK